jgi:hypothetical protein
MIVEPEFREFDLVKIQLAISEPRIRPYLLATIGQGDLKQAIQAYQYNIQLCETMYPSLHTFEVTFRNKMNQSLIDNYGLMWHSNNSLLFNEQERSKLDKAINFKNIAQKLKIINRLRNRVFHYKPIWKPNYNPLEKYEIVCVLIIGLTHNLRFLGVLGDLAVR